MAEYFINGVSISDDSSGNTKWYHGVLWFSAGAAAAVGGIVATLIAKRRQRNPLIRM